MRGIGKHNEVFKVSTDLLDPKKAKLVNDWMAEDNEAHTLDQNHRSRLEKEQARAEKELEDEGIFIF